MEIKKWNNSNQVRKMDAIFSDKIPLGYKKRKWYNRYNSFSKERIYIDRKTKEIYSSSATLCSFSSNDWFNIVIAYIVLSILVAFFADKTVVSTNRLVDTVVTILILGIGILLSKVFMPNFAEYFLHRNLSFKRNEMEHLEDIAFNAVVAHIASLSMGGFLCVLELVYSSLFIANGRLFSLIMLSFTTLILSYFSIFVKWMLRNINFFGDVR